MKSYASCVLHSVTHQQSCIPNLRRQKLYSGPAENDVKMTIKGKQELRFMCTALSLDEIYPTTKFHNHS